MAHMLPGIVRPPVRSKTAAAARRVTNKLPWPILAFIFVMLLPHTLAFSAGPLLITSFRMVMIVLAIPIAMQINKAKVKLKAADWLIVVFSVWTVLCISINYQNGQNVERAGQFILEVLLPYLLARGYYSDLDQIDKTIKYLFIIVIVAFVLAIPEAISHQKPIIAYTSKLTGINPNFYGDGTDIRHGLRRPQAFFENPILYGIFCATAVPLIWYSEKSKGVLAVKMIIVAAATAISMSSAPLLMMMSQFAFIAIDYATRSMKSRVLIISAAAITLFLALEFLTKSGPLGIIINYLTFNQTSSYARVLIWDYGLQNIIMHPFFGMVVEDWERAAFMSVSVDNFWIYTGLLSGFVGWGLLTLAAITLYRSFLNIPLHLLTKRQIAFRRSWSIMMLAFLFTGFSVMFFGKLQPYFYFLFGMGAAASSFMSQEGNSRLRSRDLATQDRRIKLDRSSPAQEAVPQAERGRA